MQEIAEPSGPRLDFAIPCAMKPIPDDQSKRDELPNDAGKVSTAKVPVKQRGRAEVPQHYWN